MGFDPYSTIGVIAFEGTRFKGAEIRARIDVPLGDYLEFIAIQKHDEELDWFAEHALVSWNLEKKGEPIPCDAEHLKALPLAMTRVVVRAWAGLAGDAGAPLEEPSNAGGTSAGA